MKEALEFGIVRLVFALICGGLFYIVNPFGVEGIVAFLIGFGGSTAIILGEILLRKINIGVLMAAIVGMSIGLVIATLISHAFRFIIPEGFDIYLNLGFGLILAYAGAMIFLRERKREVSFTTLLRRYRRKAITNERKILDTNVIIDGRIIGICDTGFLDGMLVIPDFVLQELQRIADSSDPLRRKRGRMGLDMLDKIKRNTNVDIIVSKRDFPDAITVDEKLILLAKETGAKILTNDFSLSKVARLKGVNVLNVNELASVLKPVILAGEVMNVKVIREGKEEAQGVAYLDDGTMVVIEEGRNFIGKNIEVIVTSTLQTETGKMIFARPWGEASYSQKEPKISSG